MSPAAIVASAPAVSPVSPVVADAVVGDLLAEDLIEESLVEEISIDGMCGVY